MSPRAPEAAPGSAGRAGPAGGAGPAPARRRGPTLAGTGTLIRFALRRDRVRLSLWIAGLAAISVAAVSNFPVEYPNAEDRAEAAETLGGPAGTILTGPARYLDGEYHFGAMAGHQILGLLSLFIALMSVLTVVRHSRTEEETGRAELLRSSVVGRHAPLTSALAVAVLANLALGLLLWGGLSALALEGFTGAGSALYAAASAAVGVTFAAVAAVTVQITPYSRGASGMALAAVGAAFALRATGDVSAEPLSWLSPVGWAQRTHVHVDDRWWPLLLHLALTVACLAAGYLLSTRRDVGAGLRPAAPGRPAATAALARPTGLALRLQRGLLLGFASALLLFGAMLGSVLGDADSLIADSSPLRESIEALGGGLAEALGSVLLSMTACLALAYAVLAALRLRAEETVGRAEPLLATALSRRRWAASHLLVAVAGGTGVLALGGLGMGAAGAATGEGGLFGPLLLSSLAYAPALWCAVGLAVALFGWFPRAVAAAWFVPGYSLAVVYLNELVGLPAWMSNLSPLGHVPRVPSEELTWPPLLVLTALALALGWLGLAGFRARDLESK